MLKNGVVGNGKSVNELISFVDSKEYIRSNKGQILQSQRCLNTWLDLTIGPYIYQYESVCGPKSLLGLKLISLVPRMSIRNIKLPARKEGGPRLKGPPDQESNAENPEL